MKAIDTNVLARWLLRDDPEQTAIADRLLAKPCHISLTVLVELGWVLIKAMRLPRHVVAEMMESIVELDAAVVEHAQRLDWALERFRSGADWGDVVHLVANCEAASAFVTFDKALVSKAALGSPVTIELLGR